MNEYFRSNPGRLGLPADRARTATSRASRLAEVTARRVAFDTQIHQTGTRSYRLATSKTSHQASPRNTGAEIHDDR